VRAADAEPTELLDDVPPQGPGVRDVDPALVELVRDRRADQLVSIGPAPIDHRPAGAVPLSDGLDRKARIAVVAQLRPSGLENRRLELSATSAAGPFKTHLCILSNRGRVRSYRYMNVSYWSVLDVRNDRAAGAAAPGDRDRAGPRGRRPGRDLR